MPGVLFLLAFLLYPTLQLLRLGIIDPRTGALTLAGFARLGIAPVYLRVLGTTFATGAETTALCLLLGYPLAHWLAGLPARKRRLLTSLVLLPFWTSPLVLDFAWLVLLGRNGAVANLLVSLGLGHPDLLFGHGTVLFALVHSMMPLAVVAMLPVMAQLDGGLRQAAATLGATASQTFLRITLPQTMPGVAAAGMLVFIHTIGFFVAPAILGGPRDAMLGQLIINQIQTLQRWNFGAVLATLLIAASLATCLLCDRAFRPSSTSAGDGSAARGLLRGARILLLSRLADLCGAVESGLGGRRVAWLLPTYSVALIALSLAPIAALVPMGFTSSSFLSFPPPGISLRWFSAYLDSPVWIAATLRSFGIGLVTATLALTLATGGAVAVSRGKGVASRLAFLLFIAPMVVPPIVIAIALFYIFAHVGLVATDAGIVIGHTVTAIPLAFVVVLAMLRSYDWHLNQAAATLGASRGRLAMRIMAPIVRPGLAAAFILAFLQSFQELTVALFIGGGLKTTLPKQMWDSVTLQVDPTLAAASVVTIVVVTGLFISADGLIPTAQRRER